MFRSSIPCPPLNGAVRCTARRVRVLDTGTGVGRTKDCCWRLINMPTSSHKTPHATRATRIPQKPCGSLRRRLTAITSLFTDQRDQNSPVKLPPLRGAFVADRISRTVSLGGDRVAAQAGGDEVLGYRSCSGQRLPRVAARVSWVGHVVRVPRDVDAAARVELRLGDNPDELAVRGDRERGGATGEQ